MIVSEQSINEALRAWSAQDQADAQTEAPARHAAGSADGGKGTASGVPNTPTMNVAIRSAFQNLKRNRGER